MWSVVKSIYVLMSAVTSCIAIDVSKVVTAINCGGDEFVDSLGIKYEADSLNVGTSSNYGMQAAIFRVPSEDYMLYQTERYHTDSFFYTLRGITTGHYVIWLKFSEVYFAESSQKVFDVSLNGQVVIEDLDIFAAVGRNGAHDEYVEFDVLEGNKLSIKNHIIDFDGNLKVEFVKGDYDNPKINAIILYRGNLNDIPQLSAADIPVDIPERRRLDENMIQPDIEVPLKPVTEYDEDLDGQHTEHKSTLSLMIPVAVSVLLVVPIGYLIYMM